MSSIFFTINMVTPTNSIKFIPKKTQQLPWHMFNTIFDYVLGKETSTLTIPSPFTKASENVSIYNKVYVFGKSQKRGAKCAM